MMDRSKHNSGRRQNPKVPPSIPQVVVRERVILTAADLTGLAATAALRLALDGPALDDIASDLSRLLGAYVLWQRMERSGASPGDVREWAGSLAQLARDTVTAIGGNAALPCDLETREARVYPGWWHLATRGLPVTVDDPEQVDSVARLLCLAEAASSPANGPTVEAVQRALTRTIYSLSAIAILADRTAAHAADEARLLQSFGGSKTGGSEPQNSRRDLFLGLAPIFEALHSHRNYTVSKYPNRGLGVRETFSAGPAVMWTQELFKLAADPQRARPLGSPIPELVELHAWSEATREGFAKRIDEAGRMHRKNQRSGPGG